MDTEVKKTEYSDGRVDVCIVVPKLEMAEEQLQNTKQDTNEEKE